MVKKTRRTQISRLKMPTEEAGTQMSNFNVTNDYVFKSRYKKEEKRTSSQVNIQKICNTQASEEEEKIDLQKMQR